MAGDDFAPLMVGTWKQLDALARILYLESVSFDELQAFARDKEKMSSAIPAIWPIDRSALHNDHIGAFNLRRMHPVLGYIRPPQGHRPGLRPRHAGLRHGRRRGGGRLLGGATAATDTWCC